MNIGLFSLSSCSGCLVEFLNIEETILKVLEHFNVAEAQIASSAKHDGRFDIVFIEGSPTTEHQVEELLSLRERSDVLVALGTCACYGGVQTMVEDKSMKEAIERQYGGVPPVISIPPRGIGHYVDVDVKLYGCPFEKSELIELVRDVVLGRQFREKDYSVCTECILRENGCLLEAGQPCLGPVTRGGCSARCPSNGMYCTGCRGEYEDQNLPAHYEKLQSLGYEDDEIYRFYNKYYRRWKV